MLTSPKNPKVAAAVRLKNHGHREEDRRFLVEGPQSVAEALGSEGGIETLYVTDELDPLAVRAREGGVEVTVVSDDVAAKITSTVTPQRVIGVAPFLDVGLDAIGPEGVVAILHEVRDPGNAGTVLRSADAAGAAGVVFTSDSVDVYNPKTVRATAGSLFHLPVVRGVDPAQGVAGLRSRGYRILAMAADGAEDLYAADLGGGIAFLFGNEAHGLPKEVAKLADDSVRVPHAGPAESLNLAAAATVCLFEWGRRRRGTGDALETIIAAAAHDIRSPLTALKGFGFALEKRWDTMTEEQRELMLHGIVHDADRMDTILRQLVDAARVIGGNLEPFREQVDLAKMAQDLAAQQRRDPEHPVVQWEGAPVVAFVDPARLKTTILAFFESLVWWASEGPIHLRAERVGDKLHVSASRAGTELDLAGAEALFTPRRPGTGAGSKIGMYVARGVAEFQDGRTWAEVADGVLSFHVELPAVGESPV